MWGHRGCWVGKATETNVLHRIRKTCHRSHELILLLVLTQSCCKDAAAYCHSLSGVAFIIGLPGLVYTTILESIAVAKTWIEC